jgi:UDP-glucose 4-epimerase
MRVLITGHQGFIGGYLASELDPKDTLLGIDRVEADTNDLVMIKRNRGWDALVKEFDPQIVYHMAAVHFVPWCRAHPVETTLNNERGIANLLWSLDHHAPNLKAIVLASSAAVYGFGRKPFDEKSPLQPVDVYGRSKVESEKILRSFSSGRQVTCVAARLSNVIGMGDTHPHLVPIIMSGERPQLGNLWPKRDYIFVGDVVEALKRAAQLTPGFHAMNVSTGRPTTPLDIVKMAGVSYEWQPGRSDDGDLVLDPKRMERLIDYKAKTTVQEVIDHWVR